MKYTVVLQREPDGGYVATVPALPGCVSQGDSREEALRSIKEAIDLYLEDVVEAGEPIPTEDSCEYIGEAWVCCKAPTRQPYRYEAQQPSSSLNRSAHKAIRFGTLRAILHQAGISAEPLLELL